MLLGQSFIQTTNVIGFERMTNTQLHQRKQIKGKSKTQIKGYITKTQQQKRKGKSKTQIRKGKNPFTLLKPPTSPEDFIAHNTVNRMLPKSQNFNTKGSFWFIPRKLKGGAKAEETMNNQKMERKRK